MHVALEWIRSSDNLLAFIQEFSATTATPKSLVSL